MKKRLGTHPEYCRDICKFGKLLDKKVAYSRIKTQNPKLPYLEIFLKTQSTAFYEKRFFSFYDANLLVHITISSLLKNMFSDKTIQLSKLFSDIFML